MNRLSFVLLLGALAGCSSLTPAEDPVFLRLTDLEARLMRIERVVENESLIALAGEIAALRTETQSLRGEVETLRFDAENSAARQRDLYVDLDGRLQGIEQGVGGLGPMAGALPNANANTDGGSGAPPATNATPTLGSVNDQAAYDQAFQLIQARRYADASTALVNFLTAYPNSLLRDNAQYWLAETHYVQGQFSVALPEFQRVIDDYPRSAKLPDALLKVGYCNFELEQWDAARQALQQVTRLFPDSTAARLATQRLDRIDQEAG